jgi:hypothetical protein
VSEGRADAVLAASIFHFGEFTVRQAKDLYARARDRGPPVSDLDPGQDWLDALKWDEQGMIPAIAQDAAVAGC